MMTRIVLSLAIVTTCLAQPSAAVRVNIGAQNASSVERIANIVKTEFDGSIVRTLRHRLFLTVDVPKSHVDGLLTSDAIRQNSRYVEQDAIMTIPEYDQWMEAIGANVAIATAPPAVDGVPGDPYYDQQNGPPCVDAEAAWDVLPENRDVIVVIIDTGIDLDHPDLEANINRDLDWDFVGNDDRPKDDMGHGTHCAGIIGAVTDNAVGIAGLAQVSLVGVKALSQFGLGMVSNIVAAIYHAGDINADFVNMSLGSPSYNAAIHDAVQQVSAQGTLIIAAAGNSGNQNNNYPAAHPEVMGVSAINQSCSGLASFSSYGEQNVEIAAPGENIFSTLPNHPTWYNRFGFLPRDYGNMSGTSMACPQVVGIAAGYKAYDPTLEPQRIRELLKRFADDKGDPVRYGAGFVDFFPFAD